VIHRAQTKQQPKRFDSDEITRNPLKATETTKEKTVPFGFESIRHEAGEVGGQPGLDLATVDFDLRQRPTGDALNAIGDRKHLDTFD